MSWLSRLTNVFRTDRLDRDLDDEARYHIEQATEQLIRTGMAPRDAALEARRLYGNPLQMREASREAKLVPWLESVLRDSRFGLRMLSKDRVVAVAAVVSLSLTIGACTAAFSLIDALMLRPLPVRDPHSLVYLVDPPSVAGQRERDTLSYPLLERLREAARPQVDLFGMGFQGFVPVIFDDAGNDVQERIRLQYISGDSFDILGIKPTLGRLLLPADDRHPGESPVAVLSYDFWMRRFGGSPAVLGRWFASGQKRFQVVGVAQKGFQGNEPGLRTDAWAPNMMFDQRALTQSSWSWLRILGRLKPGVTSEQARQALQAAFAQMHRENPKGWYTQLYVRSAAHGPSRLRRDFERPLWILAAVVGLVLLIACSNVANLFTARAAAREREMAMRLSIGASRGRLIQQALTESAILAFSACLLGLVFARAAAPAIINMLAPADNPAYLDIQLGWRVLAFVTLIGAAATVLFGLVPALRVSAVSPNVALQAGSGKLSVRTGILQPLVAAQVGFSFMVLFVGGLLLLSFRTLTVMDLGFARTGIVLYGIQAGGSRPSDPGQAALQWLDQVRQVPGVQAASLSGWPLLDGSIWYHNVRPEGRSDLTIDSRFLDVSPGFFATMEMRLVDGRDFDSRDLDPKSLSVIVNQAFARRCFPGESPLGKRFQRTVDSRPVSAEIVGVAQDAKYDQIRQQPPPTVYVPMRRLAGTLEVRTSADPKMAASSLREAIERIDHSVRLPRTNLQSTMIENMLIPERLLAILSGFFALVATVLAAIGLYGVLSYSVIRHTKEIGIRVALGARRFSVVRLVISEITLVIVLGLAAGMAGGIALARLVRAVLFEVKPSDFASLALPLICLLLASVLAALPPVLRATRVDPMVALRYE